MSEFAIEMAMWLTAERCAQRWAAIFPDSFYIEIQRAGQPNMDIQVRQSVALAARLQLPVVATHPIQFLTQGEFVAHEARTCIAEGEILANARRVRRFNEQQNFKSQAEMAELFADLPGAVQNSIEIAKALQSDADAGQAAIAEFPDPGWHDHR